MRALGTTLLVGCVLSGIFDSAPPSWQAPLLRDHPLVGTIWDTRSGEQVLSSEALRRMGNARFVLLGEKHDNPDHHRLQAWVLQRLIDGGRHPVVAFEAFTSDVEEALQRHVRESPRDAAGLAEAVGWEQTGWPSWELYLPIAEVALGAGLEIVPANVSREEIRQIRREGLAALPEPLRARTGLDDPLAPAVEENLADEIRKGHCGYAPETTVRSMVRIQRARDANMADQLLARGGEEGAVLIAGNGHVRRDRGVPFYLERRVAPEDIIVLAFAEVERDEEEGGEPEGGDSEHVLFDLIWFTPRLDETDPCERFREQLEKLKHRSDPSEQQD